MIAIILAASSLLGTGDAYQCTMNPPPLAVETVKSSRDVDSFVVTTPKTMSILLKDGTLVRVISMGCADSGSVANAWVSNPPSAEDEEAWRRLLIRIAAAVFDHGESKSFSTWISDARFTHSDRFLLEASISGDIDLSIYVQELSDKMGAEITMSFTYH